MQIPNKDILAPSIFALVAFLILGGTIFVYSYLKDQNEKGNKILSSATDVLGNQTELTIQEIKYNLKEATLALESEKNKFGSMKIILSADSILKRDSVSSKIQAKIEAKRMQIEETFKEWLNKRKDPSNRELDIWQSTKDTYKKIIETYLDELQDIINTSSNIGLTEEQMSLLNSSIEQTIENTNSSIINISSLPPLSIDSNQTTDSDSTPEYTSSIPGISDLIPDIVITENDIVEQQAIVDEAEEIVNQITDQLDEIENGIPIDQGQTNQDTGGNNTTIIDDTELPPLPPPRTNNSNKPKLLQGSDL
ncbi:MAG: hypothetical protein WCW03_01970 [Candidatus Paceibacterota bacterium]|jgi:hypothetical protein